MLPSRALSSAICLDALWGKPVVEKVSKSKKNVINPDEIKHELYSTKVMP